jgi:hypothetical protein
MRFRGAKNSEDWDFGRGKQCYLNDNDAIAANIATTLRTFQTECFYNEDFGVPWFDLLGQKKVEPLLLTIKQVVAECYGVISVNNISAEVADDRSVVVRYSVNTIFSTGLTGVVIV